MKKVFGMIGLAKRAGKVVSGEKNCKEAIKRGTALLCILANDASDNTKKSITNSCSFYETELITFSTVQELGYAIGNAKNSAIAITDENFAKAILNIINP